MTTPLRGAYSVDVHSQVRTCFKSDFTCGAWRDEKDVAGSFSVWSARGSLDELYGELKLPGVALSALRRDYELWDVPAFVYYPKAGENFDIWSTTVPTGATWGPWIPELAKDWVRVMFDACWGENWTGFVHIDIDVATGRVLDFARKCDDEYGTLWDEYRLRGTGKLACELPACNELANTAPLAGAVVAAASVEPMTGGTLTAGTYHLSSVNYQLESPCPKQEVPSVRETLVVTASSAKEGTLSFVTDRSGQPTERSLHQYAAQSPSLNMQRSCGPESLAAPTSSVDYTASPTELRLQHRFWSACSDPSAATYVYTKQ